MKKLFLLLVTVLAVTLCASAQQFRTVTGTVLEEGSDEPIIGVSVVPAGSHKGVVTDADGNFTIQVPAKTKALSFSFVGFKPVTADIKDNMVIKMSTDATTLNDVMVVAYGTVKKAEYTGSAGVVKADQLEDALVSNVTRAFSGKVSGVQTLSSNGQPGTSATVLIRGVGSINGSTAPLYVVDGMPYDGGISEIATSDIESMTVLKDAASTALYGARGANGVVLITTKKGSAGQTKINVDMRWGANTRALSNYDVIDNGEQYLETLYKLLYTQQRANGLDAAAAAKWANNNIWAGLGQQSWTVPAGQYVVGANGKFNPNVTRGNVVGGYYYTPDDWTKETLRTGLRQEYNLSVTGGANAFSYYVAGSYLSDEGLIAGSHYKRFSARTNVDYQAKKWLKIGTNTSYVYANSGYPDDQTDGSSTGNAFGVVNTIAPVYPIYARDAMGNIIYNSFYNRPIYDYGVGDDAGFGKLVQRSSGGWSLANPAGDLAYNLEEYLMDVLDSKWYAVLTPVEGLTVTATAGYFVDNTRTHYLNNPIYGQSARYGGQAIQVQDRSRTINLQGLASYQRTFNNVHNAEIMVGVESSDYNYESVQASGENLYNPTNWTVNNTIDNKIGYGSMAELAHRSGFGRVKYNYDNKYFFMASFRRDGSSAFAPDHRWGSFWSVSGAWDLKKESFLREVTAVDLLKFKASFGQNGNDRVYNGTFLQAYQDYYRMSGADGIFSDATLAYKGNPDITWEKSNNFNIGFDFSFWNGKLDGTIEYYSRQTKDMLMSLPVPASLGYSSMPANVGSMRNYGVEIDLNARVIDTKDITLDLFANATFGKNKVISIADNLLNNDGAWEYSSTRLIIPGESLYNRYLVHYAGVDDKGIALYTALQNKEFKEIPEGADANAYLKQSNGTYLHWYGTYKTNYKGQFIDSTGNVIEKPYEVVGKDDKGNDITALMQSGVKNYEQEEYDTTNYNTAYNTNRKLSGNVMPKVYGGFGFDFKAYGFDLSMQFAYQAGGKIIDSGYQGFMQPGTTIGQTWHKDMLKAWAYDQDNKTNVPRMATQGLASQYANSTSDRFLISSNYVSLNNITLGYTFPTKWTSKIGINTFRLYGAAENVALWSRRKGLDPRQGFISSDNSSTYSPIRVISGGVKIGF